MGRRRRGWLEHCCYHVTHRCHDRAFLFRFALDRQNYVNRLREMTRKYAVDVLDYMITSNHIHLILWSRTVGAISSGMQFLQGTCAQDYNRRKKREGSFWRDRYHTTLIQNGSHLCRCLIYVDLNMVRAGVGTIRGRRRLTFKLSIGYGIRTRAVALTGNS